MSRVGLPVWTARLTLAALAMVVIRLPFIALPVLPYYLEFNPGVALIPLFAICWGPWAAVGIAVGTLLGDVVSGMWNGMTLYKVIGLAGFALVTARLIRSRPPLEAPHSVPWPLWTLLSLPGILFSAAVNGLGAEWNHLYPFGYIVLITCIHHAFFCMTAGPLFLVRGVPRLYDPPESRTPLPRAGRAALLLSGLGACLSGWFAEKLYYGRDLLDVHVLGETNGPLVSVFAAFFVFVCMAALARSIPLPSRRMEAD